MKATPCWEFNQCNQTERCPAYPARGFDCWNVEGTMCKGERQGSYDHKILFCRRECNFYDGIITGKIKIA